MTGEPLDPVGDFARAAVAAAIRVQAAGLRSVASLIASEARSLDDIADGIEAGTVEMPSSTVPLKLVPVDDEPATEGAEAPPLQALAEGRFGSSDTLTPADGGEFSSEMVAWLDLFDDRLRGSRWFVPAVNEAASASLPLTEETARLVAARVRELNERNAS